MIEADMTHWEERWHGLRFQIEQLEATTRMQLQNYGMRAVALSEANCDPDEIPPAAENQLTLSTGQKSAIEDLCNLLTALGEFGKEQFLYFKKEFAISPDPEKNTEYPQEHVMRVTLDQISYDLWVISNAINQRFSQVPGVNLTLERADVLCMHALKPAEGLGFAKGVRVICYFLKSPSIRVIPYAETALIGIPLTAICKPRDLLAIPHEIGHFVYWKGMVDKKPSENGEKEIIGIQLERLLPDVPVWAKRWLEELFADIYGCMVAGPVLALSFQELHFQQTQSAFYEDDWDHPPPILRPNIYAKGMDKAGYSNWAKVLCKNWNGGNGESGRILERRIKKPKRGSENSVNNRDYKHEFRLKPNNETDVTTAVSLDPTVLSDKPVDRLIKYVIDEVIIHLDKPGENWWREDVVDSLNSVNVEGLPALFKAFEDKVDGIDIDSSTAKLNQDRVISTIPYQTLKDRWLSRPKNKLTDPDWLRVFDADGWTTEGPHSNPPPP